MENILIITAMKTERVGLAELYGAAFRRLGFAVSIVGIEPRETQPARMHERIRGLRAQLSRRGLPPDKKAPHLIETAKSLRPLLTIVTRGERLKADTVREIRKLSSLGCVNIYTDAPFAIPGRSAAQLFDSLSEYTAVFPFSKALIPVFFQLGAKAVHWLPFAYSADVHLATRNIRFGQAEPLIYVGSWGTLVERWLEPLASMGLRIYGNGWHHLASRSPLRKCLVPGKGVGRAMRDVIRGALITVNFVRAEHGCAHSMKTFEIPACGGFMVTNRTDEQEFFFRDKEHCLYFDRPADLLNTVSYFLNAHESREEIARQGHERVLPHNYEARAQSILEFLRSGTWIE